MLAARDEQWSRLSASALQASQARNVRPPAALIADVERPPRWHAHTAHTVLSPPTGAAGAGADALAHLGDSDDDPMALDPSPLLGGSVDRDPLTMAEMSFSPPSNEP